MTKSPPVKFPKNNLKTVWKLAFAAAALAAAVAGWRNFRSPPPAADTQISPTGKTLKQGDFTAIIPTPESYSAENPQVVKKVQTATGEAAVFGWIKSFSQDNEITVDYGEGTETLKIDQTANVYLITKDGGRQTHDIEFLKSLNWPQLSGVGYLAETKTVLAVTIYPTK